MNKIFLLFIITAIAFPEKIFAQRELSLKIGNEIPMGELRWVYKSAPSISIGFSVLKEKSKVNQSLGIGVGFFQFKPQEEIFYYLLNSEEYGTAQYSNYKVFQLFVPMRIDFLLNEKFELFGGVDFGYYYVIYSYHTKDKVIDEEGEAIEGKGALAPKAGINYNLSKKVGLTLQAKYNLYFSLGSSDQQSSSYNSNIGSANHFASLQLGTYIRL
ncbi:MAG TPA: hypothetical protein VF691_01725 [Cytophagaceae bacterium]|jgi:hypothetical protein